MDLLDSNHGSLVFRRAYKHGIPKAYIKKYIVEVRVLSYHQVQDLVHLWLVGVWGE